MKGCVQLSMCVPFLWVFHFFAASYVKALVMSEEAVVCLKEVECGVMEKEGRRLWLKHLRADA